MKTSPRGTSTRCAGCRSKPEAATRPGGWPWNADFPWERRESRSCRPPRCASAGMRTPSSRLASLLQGPSKPKRLPLGAPSSRLASLLQGLSKPKRLPLGAPSSRLASLLQGPSTPRRLPVGATQVAIPRSIRRDRLQRLVQLEPAQLGLLDALGELGLALDERRHLAGLRAGVQRRVGEPGV